ncbi:MAG TPA: OB-fold nucleic acid binding domain-containing protein, partial [Dehalococcoidia bacterium]|nr:OB-fold nucleic acid binding domain-containing protein [Dehalococcoidia bacterium]
MAGAVQRVFTSELPAHAGERVRLEGWLHRLRRLSGVTFLILRDGSGLAQVVVHEPSLDARLAELHAESVLAVEGRAVA